MSGFGSPSTWLKIILKILMRVSNHRLYGGRLWWSASRTVLRWMMVWDRLGITKRFSFYVYWRILFVKESKKRLSSRLSYSKVNGNPTVFSLLNSSSSNSLSAWAAVRRFRWSVIICTHHSNWTSSPILTVLFWGLITNLGPRRIRNDISLDITPAEFDALHM